MSASPRPGPTPNSSALGGVEASAGRSFDAKGCRGVPASNAGLPVLLVLDLTSRVDFPHWKVNMSGPMATLR